MRTYDDRSGMRRGPLAERLLAVAVLVVLWLLLSALVVWGAQPDPAGAFPADTLLYLDLRQPVDTLDTLSGMPPWQAVEDLVAAAADTGMDGDGVAAALRRLMAAWHNDVQLHEQLRTLAGERLLFAIVPGAAGGPVSPVVVLSGGPADAQLEALAALLLRLGPRATGEIRWTGDAFELMAADGTPLAQLRVAAGWLLLGRAGDDSPLPSIAAALASGEVGPGSLGALGAYGDAMARLPATPAVLGFVNVPAIAAQADTMTGLSASTARLIHQMPGCFDGFGFSREIGPDVIRTRVAGSLAAVPPESPFCDLLQSLNPLTHLLSRRLPAEALATHDLGAAPGDVYELVASVLRAVNHGEEGGSSTFDETSGLDPTTDLFPYLGRSVASALLPASIARDEPALPRPIVVAEVTDKPAVCAFLDAFLRWEAGDVAARSRGLVSATVVTETYEGVTIRGLQIESVMPGALPSPSYTVDDGLLVVSPARSAVREAVSSIQATAGSAEPPIEGSPVELFHADLCAVSRELGRGLSPLLSRLSQGDGLPVVGCHVDRVKSLAPPLLALVGSLGQADGWTTLTTDGAFDAAFELYPRECATGLDQPQQARPAVRRVRPSLRE